MQKSSLALFVGYVLYEGLVRFRTFNRFETEGPFSGLSNVILTPQTVQGGDVIVRFYRNYGINAEISHEKSAGHENPEFQG